MKLETVKTFILVILIGISLLLSYTLWTYQPNADSTIGDEIVDNVLDAGGDSDRSKRTVIQPTDIIFHVDGRYYGHVDPIDREALYVNFQNWVMTDFTTGDSLLSSSGELIDGIELSFNGDISMDVLKSIFSFADEELVVVNASLQRIYIHFIHESKSLHLEFVSDEDDFVRTAAINDPNAFEALWEIYSNIEEQEIWEYTRIGEGTAAFYFPADELRLPTYSITPRLTSPELFVNLLFSNPSVVRETNSQSIGETYFTDSRQLSVYQNRKRMEYISHVISTNTEDAAQLTKTDLIDMAIENINAHSGWTDDYRLEQISLLNNRIRFQLYFDGYPVFNNNQLTMIEQVWSMQQNSMQLVEYDRPLYSFEGVFEFWEVDSLISGTDLLVHLENNLNKVVANLQDIKVGYELSFQVDDLNSEYIELLPAWFIKENNMWQKVDTGTNLSLRGVEKDAMGSY